ncbi:hypothetical protein BG015_006045 [Linnemannia schmuckeri]|uniref:Uncharacterized protein n=1 Tax=Linnemannia schmuckeri TaxID=64567 RepID=A0A9P5S2H8_9FUNG|nr:hypothetical protein BG015_006045 [Linnemannia schmuckeri]
MENTEQVQDQDPQVATEDTTLAMDSSIPTPVESVEGSPAAVQGETIAASEASLTPSELDSVSTPDQQQQQQAQPSSQPASIKPSVPVPPPQLKRRPRRTGQPLHLLLQDCSRQHITGHLCKKTSEEITAVVTEKKTLAADLRTFSNEFVLTSARDRVISEVDEEGKELLKDVDPERDVIKQRFEDESSVFKAYEDAIHDIRVDLYLDGIKPRKSETDEEREETAARNVELNAVLQVWDTLHKRVEIEPRRAGRSTQNPYPSRGGRAPGPPGTRPHPYAPSRLPPSSPHYGPPFAGPPHAGPSFREPRSHHRDYHDRPAYRDDYYADRRDDHRRPDYDRRDPRDHPMGARPPGPGPMGRPDLRDMRDPRDPRDFRERGPPPPAARGEGPFGASRYDDRRRDRADLSNAPPPRDNRHHASTGAGTSPLTAHPSLPPKPTTSQYDANPAIPQHMQAANPMYPGHYPSGAHQQPPLVDPAAQAAYGAYGHPGHPGYPAPGQADYSGYAYGYGQDPAAQQQIYGYASAGGWDMSGGAGAAVGQHVGAGLHLQPFTSGQHGRHKAVPLPTDFMSGPSDAPRLSMPEPHEVLGTIRGVIIRDAHGNIGLSQYHFTQAT